MRSRSAPVGNWLTAIVSVLPKIVDNLGKIDDALIRGIESVTGTGPAQAGIPPAKAEEIEGFINRARALIESLRAQVAQANQAAIDQRREDRERGVAVDRERAALMSLFEPLGLVTRRQYNRAHGYQSYQWAEHVVGPVSSEDNPTGADPMKVTPAVRAAVEQLAVRLRGGLAHSAHTVGADDDGDGIVGTLVKLGAGFALGRLSKR